MLVAQRVVNVALGHAVPRVELSRGDDLQSGQAAEPVGELGLRAFDQRDLADGESDRTDR